MDSGRETRTVTLKARLMAVYEKEVIYPAAINGRIGWNWKNSLHF